MCSIDCADSVCDLLNSTDLYTAKMVGPSAHPKLTFNFSNLNKATCLVVPGGLGDADQFDNKLTLSSKMVTSFVARGGKYLGICQGSYFAGKHYFNILDGYDAVQYIKTKDACTRKSTQTVVTVSWNGEGNYPMFFYDGAAFIQTDETATAQIISNYQNGNIAALIQDHKKGRIGVIGPHPEAYKWWFYTQKEIQDRWKDCVQQELLLDFIKKLLK